MGWLLFESAYLSLLVPILVPVVASLLISSSSDLSPIGFLGVYATLSVFGLLAYKTWRGVYTTWIGVLMGHNVNLRRMGKWAVVTGATDGIGLAIARQLAKRGLNIVLMSRSLDRLERCAKEIQLRYGVQTKVIQVDFSQDVFAYQENVDKELEGMEIGTLVNNVGMTYAAPELFHHVASPDFVNKMININVTAVTMMTRAVLPGMLDRGKGVVMNIGTLGSVCGGPYFSLYTSTKAFMHSLTADLAEEYKDKGIIFQYQCPGYVDTKIAKQRKPSFFVPTPQQYAIKAINSIGLQHNSAIWTSQRILVPIIQTARLLIPQGYHKLMTSVVRTFWLFAKKRQMQKDPEYSNTLGGVKVV